MGNSGVGEKKFYLSSGPFGFRMNHPCDGKTDNFRYEAFRRGQPDLPAMLTDNLNFIKDVIKCTVWMPFFHPIP